MTAGPPSPASPPRAPPAAPERERRSACAEDARRRERERLLALSPEERALLALDLGERYAAWARVEP